MMHLFLPVLLVQDYYCYLLKVCYIISWDQPSSLLKILHSENVPRSVENLWIELEKFTEIFQGISYVIIE